MLNFDRWISKCSIEKFQPHAECNPFRFYTFVAASCYHSFLCLSDFLFHHLLSIAFRYISLSFKNWFDTPQTKYCAWKLYQMWNYNCHAHKHIAGIFPTAIDLIYVSIHPRAFPFIAGMFFHVVLVLHSNPNSNSPSKLFIGTQNTAQTNTHASMNWFFFFQNPAKVFASQHDALRGT